MVELRAGRTRLEARSCASPSSALAMSAPPTWRAWPRPATSCSASMSTPTRSRPRRYQGRAARRGWSTSDTKFGLAGRRRPAVHCPAGLKHPAGRAAYALEVAELDLAAHGPALQGERHTVETLRVASLD